ncbi:GntR family transcriptional regulator [Corynebacterium sp. H130]|uniref:GntR family transcriptional regulator n=1 Tax=Corynebacterium sp. H130 TaxID=3133444 RepID=UPI0030AC7CE1
MSPLDPATSAHPVTQAQIAYNALRRAITSGELPGGAHIVQSEWADRIDVSITPVREAIRRLEQDGLARSEAHKGTTVTTLNLAAAEEIYALRQVIEPMQLRRTQGRLAGTVEQARQLCDQMAAQTDPVEFCDYDQKFHRLFLGLDDSWTSRVTGHLLMAASPYITIALNTKLELMAVANEQHFQLLAAVEKGDLAELISVNARHLTETMAVLEGVTFPISLNNSAQQ